MNSEENIDPKSTQMMDESPTEPETPPPEVS